MDAAVIDQHVKKLQLMSKMKKIGSQEELTEAQDNLSTGHTAFSHKKFEKSGGGG